MTPPRVIFLGGPTAVGKTDVAVELADRIGGEVVNADSVQLYRGFDIGSAKPSVDERARARHHLVDVLDPTEVYSANRFVADADAAIDDIARRGRVPLVVGGTGLYLRSLLHGLFDAPQDPAVRARLRARAEVEGPAELHAELGRVDPVAAARIDPADAIRIVRALEVHEVSGRPISEHHAEHGLRDERYTALVVTLTREAAAREARIAARASAMLDAGLVDEVRALRASGVPADAPPMLTVGYREVNMYLDGVVAPGRLRDEIQLSTRRLAKRQLTWFRGQWRSRWVDAGSAVQVAGMAAAVEAFVAGRPVDAFGTDDDAHLRR